MSLKTMPTDQSCRIHHGGCGRPVVLVRETSSVSFGRLAPKEIERQVAVHDDEVNGRQVVRRPNPNTFSGLRLKLELACAAQHERRKEAVGV